MNIRANVSLLSRDLTDEGQSRIARQYSDVRIEDCFVYHWFDTPDGKTIPGVWDLRHDWRSYLGMDDRRSNYGNVQFENKRVLEIGPASGYLTFKMEGEGGEIVSFDVAPNVSPDVMPCARLDHGQVRRQFARDTHSVRAAWWYFHKMFGSKAKAVYGDIYRMPRDIGTFDVSVLGAVLLHLANPFAALTEVARLTRQTIIIADLYDKRLDGGAFMEINPHRGKEGLMAWWLISPQACEHMLHANGFEVRSITYQDFNFHPTKDPNLFHRPPFFTLVAERM